MKALQITRLYLLENLRRQLHLITLFVAVIELLIPVMVNAFGLSGFERISKDFGLTLLGFFGVGMAVFLGSTAVPADVERRTLYPLLARPLPRLHYLAGKLLGIVAVLAASLLAVGLCLLFSAGAMVGHYDPAILLAVAYYFLESCVLAAGCLAVSTVASPALSGVVGVFAYIVGGLPDEFIRFFLEPRGTQVTALLARSLKLVLPNFQIFHIKDSVVHGDPVVPGYLAAALGYGVVWVFLLLLVAGALFERRDL
ncbi:MAG TPA: ABC transporter permease [Candidatus Nitrosotenuis sp.]|jgi:ABC-type transport system involved in multi-copper enzyme maturation permease subunit|nr:ABC transporter permease [Candidatus Nitrosotenuis sp.]